MLQDPVEGEQLESQRTRRPGAGHKRKKLLLFTINAAKKINLLSEEQIVLINNETFKKMKEKKILKKSRLPQRSFGAIDLRMIIRLCFHDNSMIYLTQIFVNMVCLHQIKLTG